MYSSDWHRTETGKEGGEQVNASVIFMESDRYTRYRKFSLSFGMSEWKSYFETWPKANKLFYVPGNIIYISDYPKCFNSP